LQFLQDLLIKESSIELTELKSNIESSNLNQLDKESLSKIPDNSLKSFIKEIYSYREIVSADIKKLNNDII